MNAAPGFGGLDPSPHRARVSSLDALRFVFRQPDAMTTILIGLVFLLIPVIGSLAFAGYGCEVHQRLVRRHPRPLPKLDFSDLMHYFERGVAPFVVSLIVALPVTFLAMGLFGVSAAAGVFTAHAAGSGAGVAVGGVLGLVAFGVLVVFGVLANAVQTRVELGENIGEALELGEAWQYAQLTWKRVLVKQITFTCLSFGIVLLGMLACYIGLYPAIVLIQIAAVHLRFQIYDGYLDQGHAPLAIKPSVQLPSEAAVVPRYG